MNYEDVLLRTGLKDSDVINAYVYGSRVYRNAGKHSDYDYIFVVKKVQNEQYSDNLININFFTLEQHIERVNEHEISALECLFLPTDCILKETVKVTFKLDIAKLRHSLSKKSSNSWVKCKKKLTVPQDYDLNVGRKSMFHAFRIIDFGVQIATTGKINDYSSMNTLFSEIMNHYEWAELFSQFKTRYNNKCSEFKSVTHK